MKKQLLLSAALFTGLTTFAQFEQSNEPQVNDGTTLYVIDSMAPAFENETGASAEWDYSSYAGYEGEARNLTAIDPTLTTNGSEYPSSTVALDIENFLINYTSSSATERTGHGFVYIDGDLGDVVVVYDVDPAIQYNYPFDLSDNFTDTYSGSATFNAGTGDQTEDANGEITAEVDGTGTLMLANGVNHTNVYRYKLVDSTTVNNVPFIGDVTLHRTQYEYYDLNNQTMPLFIHTSVVLGPTGGAPISQFSLVMSEEEPSGYVGVGENQLARTKVYPNPANETLNLKLPNNIDNAEVSIVDVMGRTVLDQSIVNDYTQINVSHLEKGMYVVNIKNGDSVESKNIVIR
ncbi:MAG: T9SS type A sorting domain-containing protein [Brumimicrobium sp.]